MHTKTETLVLDLNPTIPPETQIQRGNYNYANPDINTRNFNFTLPAGKREIVLYDPKGFVSSEEMIRRMKEDGCVPGVIDDCLAMGQQHPNRQRGNPIVFLGSVWRGAHGRRRVPVLVDCHGERKLSLCWFGDGWYGRYRFAAVRES